MKPWNSGSKAFFLFSDFCMAVRQVAGLSKLFVFDFQCGE